jgi:hypothetical protein
MHYAFRPNVPVGTLEGCNRSLLPAGGVPFRRLHNSANVPTGTYTHMPSPMPTGSPDAWLHSIPIGTLGGFVKVFQLEHLWKSRRSRSLTPSNNWVISVSSIM